MIAEILQVSQEKRLAKRVAQRIEARFQSLRNFRVGRLVNRLGGCVEGNRSRFSGAQEITTIVGRDGQAPASKLAWLA